MSAIAPGLSVRDAAAAVEFTAGLSARRLAAPAEGGGALQVGELFVDGARFWLQLHSDLPAGLDPSRAVRMIPTVAEPDAAFSRALGAGAVEIAGMHDEGGWRTGRLVDLFGHQWELAQPLE